MSKAADTICLSAFVISMNAKRGILSTQAVQAFWFEAHQRLDPKSELFLAIRKFAAEFPRSRHSETKLIELADGLWAAADAVYPAPVFRDLPDHQWQQRKDING